MTFQKLTDAKSMRLLLWISWLVYFVGYLGRLNYGAVMAEMIEREHVARAMAGLVSTGAAVTYAFGQVISGILGDRFSPKGVIFFGLSLSSLCNLLLPFAPKMEYCLVVWCVNGFAQAMLWPPMLRIFTESYTQRDLSKMYVRVSTSTTAGTIVVYLLSSLCIALGNWQLVFFISAFAGFSTSIVWLLGMRKIERKRRESAVLEDNGVLKTEEGKPLSFPLLLKSGILFLAGAILLHGILKDSVTTWMPSFIIDTYHVSGAVSVLSTVIMPIVSMLCLYLATFLNDRIFKNEVVTSTVLFASSFLGSVGMHLFAGQSPVFSLFFGTVITASMYGANLMLITAVPGHFSRYGKSATLTGILNAFTYAGSAVSTYGIGAISDAFGWNSALLSWMGAAALGMLLCALAIRGWSRFLKHDFSA